MPLLIPRDRASSETKEKNSRARRECFVGFMALMTVCASSHRALHHHWSCCCSHRSSVPPFPSFSCIIAAVSCSSSELTAAGSAHIGPQRAQPLLKDCQYFIILSVSPSPLQLFQSSPQGGSPAMHFWLLLSTDTLSSLTLYMCVCSRLTDGSRTNRLYSSLAPTHIRKKERTVWGRGSGGMRRKEKDKEKGEKEKGGSNVKTDESDS